MAAPQQTGGSSFLDTFKSAVDQVSGSPVPGGYAGGGHAEWQWAGRALGDDRSGEGQPDFRIDGTGSQQDRVGVPGSFKNSFLGRRRRDRLPRRIGGATERFIIPRARKTRHGKIPKTDYGLPARG